MITNETDIGVYFLVGIVVLFFLIIILFGIALFLNNFSKELKYLNNEIGRTYGAEQKYWIRQRRRLWLSLIPFVKY